MPLTWSTLGLGSNRSQKNQQFSGWRISTELQPQEMQTWEACLPSTMLRWPHWGAREGTEKWQTTREKPKQITCRWLPFRRSPARSRQFLGTRTSGDQRTNRGNKPGRKQQEQTWHLDKWHQVATTGDKYEKDGNFMGKEQFTSRKQGSVRCRYDEPLWASKTPQNGTRRSN